jgi:predicted RecA/RadA family phage recombinase
MKKLFTSLILLAVGVMVAQATVKVGGSLPNASTGAFTVSSGSAVLSGKTLTLTNAVINAGSNPGIESDVDGLTIVIKGNCEITGTNRGLYLKNNMVVIAKGGEHLRVFSDKEGYFVTSEEGIKVSGHCPSVDVLFDSAAYCGKKNALGVILTGMGSDGAAGLLNMRKMGAVTLGQSREGCVVYGMPRAAFENGSVKRQVSLERMAGEIELRLKTMDKEGER